MIGWAGVVMALCPCVGVEADGALDKRPCCCLQACVDQTACIRELSHEDYSNCCSRLSEYKKIMGLLLCRNMIENKNVTLILNNNCTCI